MFGRMTVQIPGERSGDSHGESFVVPGEAVQRTRTGSVVYKREGEGRFRAIPVQVRTRTGDQVEVSGPLLAGWTVATGDVFLLKSEEGKEAMGGGHSH